MTLMLSRTPSPEESARAAQRQDEDDRLHAANRVYRSLIDDTAALVVLGWDDHSRRDLVEDVCRTMAQILLGFTALPIVAPYARALREQAETITRREQIIEKLEDADE